MFEPQEIQHRLEREFEGAEVRVEDLTGTRDHFRVTVVSETFRGTPLIEQHKMVYAPFEQEIGGPIHAFSIKTYTPDKWKQEQQANIE